MAGATKNLLQRQGRYYARLVVPGLLRSAVGKTELRTPLGADRRIALQRFPLAMARLLDVLSVARRAFEAKQQTVRRPLNETAIAQLHYQESLEYDDADRNHSDEAMSGGMPSYNACYADERLATLTEIASGGATDETIEDQIGHFIEQLRERGNIETAVGTNEWRKLARLLASVQIETIKRSLERDRGDYSGQPSFPPLTREPVNIQEVDKLPIRELFATYLKELNRSGKGAAAKRRWAPVIESVITFMKHDDASRITRVDIIRWKDDLLERLSPKTVTAVYLGAVRAILQYAVDNDKLTMNPATGIKVRAAAKIQNRSKGFTHDEAIALLSAAYNYVPRQAKNPRTRENGYTTAAKRWIPWICAFTGARVAEIGQLRKEDFLVLGNIQFLRISPDAGSVKTRQYRDVPLHKQLIDLGLLDFVNQAHLGPLFFDATSKRSSEQLPASHLSKRLSQWIRTLKLISEDVDPNHGWRHRFKTISRELGVDPRIADSIQGHAARTAGENYGDVSLVAKDAVIRRFAAFDIIPNSNSQ